VSFLEVGTQLRLRPFIASDGLIRMEVHPELSTGNVSIQGSLTLPNKETTQVTANIMVRDGATVVIGGLIREDLSNNTTQIPLLGSAPWIGPLFRQKRETTGRTETIVLITPKIVSEQHAAANGEEAECDFLARQQVFAEKMSPISQRYLGRRYLRMAQAAYEEGDLRAANRLVHLALHYDPINREAIHFRGVVLKESPAGDSTVPFWLRVPVAPCGAPGTVCPPVTVEPWMIDELVAPTSHTEPVVPAVGPLAKPLPPLPALPASAASASPKPILPPAPVPPVAMPVAKKLGGAPRKVSVDAATRPAESTPAESSSRRESFPLPPPPGLRQLPAGPAPRLFAPKRPLPVEELQPLLFSGE
jgi:hypothetical protein